MHPLQVCLESQESQNRSQAPYPVRTCPECTRVSAGHCPTQRSMHKDSLVSTSRLDKEVGSTPRPPTASCLFISRSSAERLQLCPQLRAQACPESKLRPQPILSAQPFPCCSVAQSCPTLCDTVDCLQHTRLPCSLSCRACANS